MEDTERKLTANDTIINLVRYINGDNKKNFYKTAEDFLTTLSSNGNHYRVLNSILSQRPKIFTNLSELSYDVKKFFTHDDKVDVNMFLNEHTNNLLNELILEWNNKDIFKLYNLPIRNKMLLHGKTGNGKTTLAKYIAHKANLPFIKIETDKVIDSHLGNTGQNINKIFASINYPCVLFYDEIDSLGIKRGQKNDHSEIDRAQNQFLINIENMNENIIFVSATNRFDMLDPAFVRRFDVIHEMTPPTENEKKSFLNTLIEYYNIKEQVIELSVENYNSYADIKSILLQVVRNIVLDKIKNIDEK